MKNLTVSTNNFTNFPISESRLDAGDLKRKHTLDLQQFTVPTPMTEQEIAPPTHVWERIVTILDEQDRLRNRSGNVLSLSITGNKKSYRKHAFVTTSAIALAAILWFLL